MTNPPSRLGYFLLARLAAAGKPPDRLTLDRAVKPYFALRLGLTDGQWRTLLGHTLEELLAAGLIESTPYCLTEAGRAKAMDFLGGADRSAELKWMALRNRDLMARALNVQPQTEAEWNRLASADGLRAAVLVKFFQLPIDPLPTLTEAFDALAWQQMPLAQPLDLPEGQRFSRDDVLRAILIPNQPGALKVRLPAGVMQAQNNSLESLRQAVINRWLNGCDAGEYHVLKTAKASETPTTPFDLAKFANRIQELARRSATGQFGEHKVFVSHVWERYRQEADPDAMTREEFNAHLINANRQNLLTLSRADLVSAMDPQDVESSEIALPHATFHFIRTD